MALSSIFSGNNNNAEQQQPTNTTTTKTPLVSELKQQISQELAIANATELVNKVTENCFETCMKTPYAEGNDSCVDSCLAKYMRSWNSISRAYIQRIQQSPDKNA
ncbi:probable Mitochondrial import inner membrane translocase subunit TIM13 [Saccharomycodes ludwigii]|uniref:Mitochondrial import inner membrane translocase subunit n=1 Tax=Saccharomycodes ludwigii TaxID=36035 RepID=A0A376B2D2_9ASCO|nr:hypothetical protein SCDLUD_004476 [Saccharomycodes ludwigii]KAH3899054.1 hypothetical protein SCDLUD_004476 [Saccharomycodes ludwigii]SSD58823.1 probable Mitochondrial import inner membrane translocase subunit TIM13 [Saccharomycodes ludwigii]